MKYTKIVFGVLVIIVSILHITGVWENMPIMFLLASLLNIFNAWDSYNNNRKIEAVMLFICSIFIGLVAVYMLYSNQ
ncbi:hypothetical protein [Terrisporobacter glycolicus]|uniref:hypothetical protein n=1 Tax=Terrisporobacter glycolicus TaxID=36841 RepID=UPI003463B8C0